MPDPTTGPVEMTEENAPVSSHPARSIRGASGVGVAESGKMNQLRKKRVPEDEKRKKPAHWAELPLKKGIDGVEMAMARFWEKELRGLLETDRTHFDALRALVEGRPEEVSKQQLHFLTEELFLAPDHIPLPDVQAVMTAALRDTPDGPAIVDPFDVRSSKDAAALKQAEKEQTEFVKGSRKNLLRDIKRLRDDKGKEPGRG